MQKLLQSSHILCQNRRKQKGQSSLTVIPNMNNTIPSGTKPDQIYPHLLVILAHGQTQLKTGNGSKELCHLYENFAFANVYNVM